MSRVIAVIGANFGDEGKGLAADHFSIGGGALVIRHNGGAQAGHTVEHEGKRFVFRQLSSGSFRRADTCWAETFLPDLFKLPEEAADFRAVSGFVPGIFAHPNARVTVIDDVIVNMALELSRGEKRHGSCGMGINEACLRNGAGFGLTVGEVMGMTAAELSERLGMIRAEYLPKRLSELGLAPAEMGEYGELLKDPAVPVNAAEGMLRGADLIEQADMGMLLKGRDTVVFEGAQGLLLDSENERFSPHVTASRTGLVNPLMLCERYGLELGTAVYVMRSCVTRHGAGPLPFECGPEALGDIVPDRTNVENEWQGKLRYAPFESPEALAGAILADAARFGGSAALFITHLNETGGMVRFRTGDIPAELLPAHPAFKGRIGGLYTSRTPLARDTVFTPCQTHKKGL